LRSNVTSLLSRSRKEMRVNDPERCVRLLERMLRDGGYREPRNKNERLHAYTKLFQREGFAEPCAIDLAKQAVKGFWKQRGYQNFQWRCRRGE